MPVVLRLYGYAFSFFSSDRDERPHVHVQKGDGRAKFWLKPVDLAKYKGFSPHELQLITRIIEQHETQILQRWHDYFDTGRESGTA